VAVKVVTDSTADLPSQIVQELDITVIPLSVNFGQETYLEGIELGADEFYEKLTCASALPTTSQPSPTAFVQAYSNLSQKTDRIISIHISPKLSGTYNSALLGREAIDDRCQIEIIDSLHASMGLGMIVIQAARAAQAGASLDEVIKLTQDVIPRTHFFGTVNTLEYLHRGGRIGKARTLLGTLLSIKPIIGLRDGEIHPMGKTRTRKKSLARLLEMAHELVPIEEISILHSTTPEEVAAFIDRISAIIPKDRICQSRIGPVIGTYLGPGTIAIGIIEKKKTDPTATGG